MSTLITSYALLQVVWWAILVVLVMAFFLMAGGDLAVGFLLPFVARKDVERRVALNAIGPTWEGNQTWFILAGGAMFAVWPEFYSALFSGFYAAIILLLFSMFLRPVCFDYRNKLQKPTWRFTWDWILCLACFLALVLSGVAAGNMYLGVPFHFMPDDMRFIYTGDFLGLIRPFPVLMGVLVLSVLTMHGAAILCLKSEGDLVDRARKYGIVAAVVSLILFIVGFIWMTRLQGFHINGMDHAHASSVIFGKSVSHDVGDWFHNYRAYPIWFILPIISIFGILCYIKNMTHASDFRALVSVVLTIIGMVWSFAVALFPFLMPSSTHFVHSLTVWDSSSSFYTLVVTLVVAIIMVPIIICYTSWIYWVMRGKVNEEMIKKDSATLY